MASKTDSLGRSVDLLVCRNSNKKKGVIFRSLAKIEEAENRTFEYDGLVGLKRGLAGLIFIMGEVGLWESRTKKKSEWPILSEKRARASETNE